MAIPAAAKLWLLLVSLLLLAVGQGIHNPSTTGLLSRLTDERSQGSTIGLSRSFGALARILGPSAGTLALRRGRRRLAVLERRAC